MQLKGHTEIAALLLDRGVSVDGLQIEQKRDLLSYAAREDHLDLDLTTKLLTSKQTLEKLHLATVPQNKQKSTIRNNSIKDYIQAISKTSELVFSRMRLLKDKKVE